MNVGIDIRPLLSSSRTGVGEYTFELLNTLFTQTPNHEFFLFYNCSRDVTAILPKWNFPHVHFCGFNYPNIIFNSSILGLGYPKIDGLVNKRYGKKLDIFFSPNINFTAVSKGTKFILTIHDLSFEYFSDCFSLKQKIWHSAVRPAAQCRRADIILVPSESTKNDLVETYKIDTEKVKVIYPGVSAGFGEIIDNNKKLDVRKKYDLPVKFILFLGTIEPRKNILGAVKAFENLQKKYNSQFSEYKLIIAGAMGWKNTEIMNAIHNTKNVRYIGYVEALDKPILYKLASIFVYPSLYEGFGIPVVEAMAAGTPVITSNRSSLAEIAGNAAYFVNALKIEEITLGMSRLLENEKLRAYFVKNGKEQAELFNWQKAAKEFSLIALL